MNSAIDIVHRSFWKRMGIAGFVFFLAKGLAWLAVPVVMYLTQVAGQ